MEKLKKQQQFCTKLLGKTKKEYFSNDKIKNLNDNKSFWETIKSNFFLQFFLPSNKLILNGKENLIAGHSKIAQSLDKLQILFNK